MKRSRFNLLLVFFSFLIAVSFGIELHYAKHSSVPFPTRLVLLLLLNLTIISLFVLMFFVAKSLLNLYLERKHKVLGYRFKTKLVIVLVVLTLIPSTALFIVSSGLITTYIDRWFSSQIRQPLESSIEVAKAVYDIERQKTLDYAKSLQTERYPSEHYRVKYLRKMPKDATETVKSAFEGKEGTEVISGKSGDIVRAVVPSGTGVTVVESMVPGKIAGNVENIKEAYENYLALESWKALIKANYLLILGFLTLIIAFMALWVGLRISRGITDPIQELAQATERVAKGNFDIAVPEATRQDEIGLLIGSFNHMVRELKEKEASLESAYFESDTRRLFIENILDNINSGVIMLDTTGAILMINKRACSIISIEPERILHHNYRELVSMINSEELQKLVGGIEGKEFKPVKKEVRAVIGGRKVILLVFITSLRDLQKYIGLLVVFDDLTDIIQAQRALTWQDVARKIAHEIKNPLTPIKLSTERMLKKWEKRDADFDEVFHRSAKTIVKEVDSLKRLVDEFSKFGKMPEIHRKPTSVATIIDEVVNLFKDYKGIEISVVMPENPPLVALDGEQFKRVLINMFDNAIQAVTHRGRIGVTVSFDASSDKVSIDIADNGTGITDDAKEKLFLPYFSTKKDGTGLGLAIANRIIKEHGGHIKVRDNDPAGTVFTIVMPIKEN